MSLLCCQKQAVPIRYCEQCAAHSNVSSQIKIVWQREHVSEQKSKACRAHFVSLPAGLFVGAKRYHASKPSLDASIFEFDLAIGTWSRFASAICSLEGCRISLLASSDAKPKCKPPALAVFFVPRTLKTTKKKPLKSYCYVFFATIRFASHTTVILFLSMCYTCLAGA